MLRVLAQSRLALRSSHLARSHPLHQAQAQDSPERDVMIEAAVAAVAHVQQVAVAMIAAAAVARASVDR